jgi:hypothetical protein
MATRSIHAAVHQQQLLEALSSGVFGPPHLDVREGKPVPSCWRAFDHPRLPDWAITEARADNVGGTVCLVDLSVPEDSLEISRDGCTLLLKYPVPLSWATVVTVTSEKAAKEIGAKAGLFPDIVLGAVTVKAIVPLGEIDKNSRLLGSTDDGLFTYTSDIADPIEPMSPKDAELLHSLDKVAGVLAVLSLASAQELRSAPSRAPVWQDRLNTTINAIQASGSSTWCEGLWRALLDVLLPGEEFSVDRAILLEFARELTGLNQADGFVPLEVLEEVVARGKRSLAGSREITIAISEFGRATAAVLQSRQELRDEHLTDAGHPGLRGALLFLLTGDQERLDRFLQLRPETGCTVALVARCLVATYSGLTALPREAKSPDPHVLGFVAGAALDALRGGAVTFSITENVQGPVIELALELGGQVLYRIPGRLDADLQRLWELVVGAGCEVRRGSEVGKLKATVAREAKNSAALEVCCELSEGGPQIPSTRCLILSVRVDRPSTMPKLVSAWASMGEVPVMAQPDSVDQNLIKLSLAIEWEDLSVEHVKAGLALLTTAIIAWQGKPTLRSSGRTRVKRPVAAAPEEVQVQDTRIMDGAF